MCKNAFKLVLLASAFLSSASLTAAECLQPVVVNPQALIAPTFFAGMRDQVMDPSAGRIASQAAAMINKKETDASINQQVEYIRCLAGSGRQKLIVASISDDGVILLQRRDSELEVAISKPL